MFNMNIESCESLCPLCKKKAKDADNCGFYDCVYSIKGEKEDGEVVEKKDQVAPSDKFLEFENDDSH